MRVILLQDVNHLGKKDEIKEVADGFARNFLLPKKLAILATPHEIEKIERKKTLEEERKKREEKKTQLIAQKIKELELVFKEKVNPEGKLYGSINAERIVTQLKEKDIFIREEQIEKFEPIKTIGDNEIKIRLSLSLTVSLKIKILPLDE
ncbi:MAG: 50S ribosomal protein L9 [Patescibacteria group bacterium]|nr:50S ribosomal protein L9 [Patescibacteria group bacterium]